MCRRSLLFGDNVAKPLGLDGPREADTSASRCNARRSLMAGHCARRCQSAASMTTAQHTAGSGMNS